MSFWRVLGSAPYSPAAPADPVKFHSFNGHVLVAGASGTGKSFFANALFPLPEFLLTFKPDVLFEELCSFKLKGLPKPVSTQLSPASVSDAYLYALGLDMSGIMASSLYPVVFTAVSKAKSFRAFFQDLQRQGKEKSVSSQVARVVLGHFMMLYPDYALDHGKARSKKKMAKRVSFAGLGSFEQDFGAELYLRYFYSQIGSRPDYGTVFIDEFHHVSRKGSVVGQLLREFRSTGRIVAVSQFLSDVDHSMLANFGHVFIGNSTDAKDLEILAKLSPRLAVIVPRLPPYVFLSLREFLASPDPVPLYSFLLGKQ